jgi:hypothetical protein
MNENKIREMIVSALLNPMPEKINSKEYVSNRKQSKSNPIDTITMDVPLFIRMMEFAREDAKSDLDLHDVAEKAISLSNSGKTLTMSDYEAMFGGKLNEAQSSSNESLAKKVEEVVKSLTTLHKNTSNNSNIPETDKKGLLRAFDMLKGDLETVVTNLKGGLSESMLDEAYVPDNIKKFAKQRGVSSLVNKAAGWAEKVGKRINGGTAIGKNYSTLVLDMGYQTGDIHINTDDETIKLYGEEVNSFPEFKEVYMENQMEHDEDESGLDEGLPKGYWAKKIPGGKMNESSSKIKNILSKIGDIEEKIYDQYGDDEIDAKFDYTRALNNIKEKYKNDEIKMYDALVSHLNKLKSSFPLKESYKTLVNRIKKQGKSEKASKAIAGAVASYKSKGGGSGPTAKQKSMAETIMSKLKG